MFTFIDKILENFRDCFSRKAAFAWFIIIVIGLMMPSDNAGITSIIRSLSLDAHLYETMNSFFRASSWSLDTITYAWINIVKEFAPIMRTDNGSFILVGDGTKISKEARYMPGVKKLHQDSENSGKAPYIFGHMFGCIGILTTNNVKTLCTPLLMQLHDGVKAIFSWENNNHRQQSHVVQIITCACAAASVLGKCVLLLDRYFLTCEALKKVIEWNTNNANSIIHLITRAKSNAVAYEKPAEYSGRGRRPVKGKSIHLKELFESKSLFKETKVYMYNKFEPVSYYAVNLLWGKGLYKELRFVLAEYNGIESIFVTTDLSMPAEEVIRLYALRFKIECSFKVMKQLIGTASYHFWSKYMPRLNKYSNDDVLEKVASEDARIKISNTIKAIEGYVNFCCIATGILQILTLTHSGVISVTELRYQRTVTSSTLSEAMMADYLQRNLFRFIFLAPDLSISQIIIAKSGDYRCDFKNIAS